MKKALLTAVLAATLFTTGFNAVNANASSKSLSTYMYQFKKVGKHVKLTKTTHIRTTKTLTRGKAVSYYGGKYYYSKQVHGYLVGSDFNYKNKKKSKVNKHYDNSNTSNTNINSSNNDVIKNGFNETTNNVVDRDEYIKVFTKTALTDINNYRQAIGVLPLALDSNLSKVAQTRAPQVSASLTHYDSNGKGLAAEIAASNGLYNSYDDASIAISENIANGPESGYFENPIDEANDLIKGWIDEKPYNGGHYLNLTNKNAHKIGIGFYIGTDDGNQTDIGYAEEYTN